MQNIHPLFAHFPVALLLAAFAFEVARLIWKRDSLHSMATGALVLGAAGALLAMLTGLHAGETVAHPEAAHEILETHEALGITVFILAAVLALLRLLRWDRRKPVYAIFFVGLLALSGLLTYGAYLGGKIVYDFGVGTALVRTGRVHEREEEERNQTDRQRNQAEREESAHEH